jgi:Mu transposase-like protein
VNYRLAIARRYYSVPYRLIGKCVNLRITAHTLEVYYRGQAVARHLRAAGSLLHRALPTTMSAAAERPPDAPWLLSKVIIWGVTESNRRPAD